MGIEVFFSYSHRDELLRDELAKHLSIMRRQGLIDAWHDRAITASSEWAGEIDTHLNSAQIILLLISADFLASDYCYDIELKRAMERHESGDACVIPIILKPVDWNGAPFGKLQALPKNAQPVTTWSSPDEAFLNIAQGIRKTVEAFTTKNIAPSAVESSPGTTSDNLTTARPHQPLEPQRNGLQNPASFGTTHSVTTVTTPGLGRSGSPARPSSIKLYLLSGLGIVLLGGIGIAALSNNRAQGPSPTSPVAQESPPTNQGTIATPSVPTSTPSTPPSVVPSASPSVVPSVSPSASPSNAVDNRFLGEWTNEYDVSRLQKPDPSRVDVAITNVTADKADGTMEILKEESKSPVYSLSSRGSGDTVAVIVYDQRASAVAEAELKLENDNLVWRLQRGRTDLFPSVVTLSRR